MFLTYRLRTNLPKENPNVRLSSTKAQYNEPHTEPPTLLLTPKFALYTVSHLEVKAEVEQLGNQPIPPHIPATETT